MRFAIPTVAAAGLFIALGLSLYYGKKDVPPPIAQMPPRSPYRTFVVGSGTIEASSENIWIGTPFNELTVKVFVKEGDLLQKGDPLFLLDLRSLEAQLNEARKSFDVAEVALMNESVRYGLYEQVADPRAISQDAYNTAYYAWQQALAEVEKARSRVETIETFIERSYVRAPFDGTVLQVNLHEGETANLNPFNGLPLMIFGPVAPLHVRVEIDEVECWRIEAGMPAVAYARGNPAIEIPLQFVRIEPMLIPKQTLTGNAGERVDTRVLQVIYSFEKGDRPIYVGEVLDVYVATTKAP